MKTFITIMICSFLITSVDLRAQVDEAKMDKDLRVASKVLESLVHEDDGHMMYNDNIEANYVEGYGVVFTIGGGFSFYQGRVRAGSYGYRSGGTITIAPRSDKHKDEHDKEQVEITETDLSKVMVEFLVDYSQLISQLKPDDKIMISTKESENVLAVSTGDNIEIKGQAGTTVEMLKKDHNDFLAGKISREKLIEKIKVNKNDSENNRSKDLDLFASMLSTVYDDEYTDSYFISWKPDYQRLSGVGAIYSFKVYSSFDENGWYIMPGINKSGLDSDQRKVEVEKLYPVFVQSMKENIVQYGRTISSLEPDEMVILKVTMTKCEGCSIPGKVQFSIKQSDLTAFRTGTISQNEAIAKVTVTDL